MRRTRLWRLLLGCLGGKGGLVSLDLMDGLIKSRVFFYMSFCGRLRGEVVQGFYNCEANSFGTAFVELVVCPLIRNWKSVLYR